MPIRTGGAKSSCEAARDADTHNPIASMRLPGVIPRNGDVMPGIDACMGWDDLLRGLLHNLVTLN
jgi:hypothetical protein